MYQGLRVCLYFYSIILSTLAFVFMPLASKMAAAVTDLTSSSKAGRREIREKAQDLFVLFIRKHKLFWKPPSEFCSRLIAWNCHGSCHLVHRGRQGISGEQGRRSLRVDVGLAIEQCLQQIFFWTPQFLTSCWAINSIVFLEKLPVCGGSYH